MQYKYIHVSSFDEVIEDMEKRIIEHYNDKQQYWRTSHRIAGELGFNPITQRETRAIGTILRKNSTKSRIYRGYIQFMI